MSPDFAEASSGEGGERGIRTLGPASGTTVFETAPFDRSGISPVASVSTVSRLQKAVQI